MKTITKRLCCTIKVQLNLFFIVVVYYVSAQCCVCKNVSDDALDAFCIVGSNSHEYWTNCRIGKSIGRRVWLSKEQFHIAVSYQLLLLGTYIYTCLLTYMYTDHTHIHIPKYIYIYICNYIVGYFFCMMVIVNFNCCIVKVL